MRIPDLNILLHAHREEAEHHRFYKDWLGDLVNDDGKWGLSALVASEFVQVVTRPAFPGGPTPLHLALAAIDHLAEHPDCVWVVPGPRHWASFSKLCRAIHPAGQRIAEARHAAVALENGAVWATANPEFEQFRTHGLQVEIVLP